MESVEVKLARLEEKIDTVLKRLETGDARFKELDQRVSEIENKVQLFMGGLLLASFIIPLLLRWMGV